APGRKRPGLLGRRAVARAARDEPELLALERTERSPTGDQPGHRAHFVLLGNGWTAPGGPAQRWRHLRDAAARRQRASGRRAAPGTGPRTSPTRREGAQRPPRTRPRARASRERRWRRPQR